MGRSQEDAEFQYAVDRRLGRGGGNRPIGKSAYGRNSRSEAYGRGTYSFRSGTFDGYPSLSRRRGDGALEIFYGPTTTEPVDLDDEKHGHAVIKDRKLVYKRRPGESTPVIDEK